MPVSDGPLSDLRVVDMSTLFAGPLAAMLLGDFGAEVIKIEHPRGDPARGHGAAKDGHGLWWKVLGRNKASVTLNLGAPECQAILTTILGQADVMIENFRPGVLERWNLGPDQLRELNPRLVCLRVTGFGQTGPRSQDAAFGTLVEAMSGFADMTGPADAPPTLPPFGLADGIAGLAGASAVMFALHSRERTGVGQVIDLALLDPLLTVLGAQATIYDQLGTIQTRRGNSSPNNAPRNTYQTQDGRWIAVSTSAQNIAERLIEAVGRPDLVAQPWFGTARGRVEHVEELDGAVGAWVGERDLEEVMAVIAGAGAAVAPVYDISQLMEDPQVLARETITSVDDDDLGPIKMQNLMFRMFGTPGAIRFTGRSLGADTEDILTRYGGVDQDELTVLRERGLV